jgi:alpha-tubulin suppressor-like RCC1 family protein
MRCGGESPCPEPGDGLPVGAPCRLRPRDSGAHRVRLRRTLGMALGAVLSLPLVVAVTPVVVAEAVHTHAHAGAAIVAPASSAPVDDSQLPSAVTYSWGSNDWGELGVDSSGEGTPTPVDQPALVDVATGTRFKSVAAGGAHTLGLTSDGQVEAWGANREGQLGDGTTGESDVPVAVDAPDGVAFAAVAAGSSHSLALSTDGQVYAWGSGLLGQLGDGSNADSLTPAPIHAPAGLTFTAVAAGGDHSLALTSTGAVYAWGANFDGQLGNGTTTSSNVPIPSTAPAGVTFTAIAAGTGYSLALTSSGEVYAWGFNGSGQLGDGTNTSRRIMTAVSLPAGVTITAIACGADHSLAISSTGDVYEWGSNVFGQLDTALVDSATVDSPVPVQPLGLPPLTAFVAVAGGLDSSYAVTSAGVVWTWGGDPYGQLGSGPPGVNAVLPAPLDSLPAGTLATGVFSGPDATAAFLVTRTSQQITVAQPSAPTYGDPPLDLAPTASSGLSVSISTAGACTGSVDNLILTGAGLCTVTADQAGSFAFYPATTAISFTVARATLTVEPSEATGVAGSSLPALGYRLNGLVDRDSTSVVSGEAACTTPATSASPPGSYPITCDVGTLRSSNYNIEPGASATLELVAGPSGYALIGSDGAVWALGPARQGSAPAPAFYGSMGGHPLNAPVVGASFTPLHQGYWLVASDGGIFAFGDAGFHGSMGGHPLNRPIVGIAGTPDGQGYWEVASDGGIFAFGDAGFYGSTGGIVLNRPIVGMASTPDGRGYWLVASDGGIFAFGDAGFYGSTGGVDIGRPVVGMAAAPGGRGYWLTTADGSVFPFGQARFEGDLRYLDLGFPISGMAATGDGGGYWLVGSDGSVYAFGDAGFYGRPLAFPDPVDGII